jgi:dihydroorotate dehydrogenase (fumarate)
MNTGRITWKKTERTRTHTPDEYAEHVRRIKGAVNIPVIASLKGIKPDVCGENAKLIQQAGADAIELNTYFVPVNASVTGQEVEARYLEILQAVKANVSIPVAVKLSPFFSSLPYFARQLVAAGADALILFNRFYQPDIDVDGETFNSPMKLSASIELRTPLRWVAILHGQVDASLALTSGVHTHRDILKAILAGADVATVCSTLYRNGINHISVLIQGVQDWMDQKGYASLSDFRGKLSHMTPGDPEVVIIAFTHFYDCSP